MNEKLLNFLTELNPEVIDREQIRFAIDKWAKCEDFRKAVKNVVCEKCDEIIEDDLEYDTFGFDKFYDKNPYDVEEQLVGCSGCWEITDTGERQAWDKAIEILIEDELDCSIIESFEDWLEKYGIDEDFSELEYLIEKIISVLKTL